MAILSGQAVGHQRADGFTALDDRTPQPSRTPFSRS
jgi:hypothetical protein